MNNKLFILPALAMAFMLPSCDNKEDEIFDADASERLDAAKTEYGSQLVADGGKWILEYFSNDEEPGYTLGMEFDPNGSVNISGNNKWLNNTFTSDRSLYELLSDDGPSLSFNSYNNVFHIFSDPVNVTGPDAPTDPDRDNEDIDETGYGHNGDYEFNIMHVSERGDSIRLRGKKRGITHWLVRLPGDTDMETYLTEYKATADGIFSSRFNNLIITAPDGELFMLKDAYKGVMSAYPIGGDSIAQTKKKNAIITNHGVRFMKEFKIPYPNDSTELVLTELELQPDGTLMAADGTHITAPTPGELLNNKSYKWSLDIESFTGELKTLLDQLAADANTAWKGKRDLTSVELDVRTYSDKRVLPVLKIKLGSVASEYYYTYDQIGGYEITMQYVDRTNNANTLAKTVPVLNTFAEKFISSSLKISTPTPMRPDNLVIEGSNGNFKALLQ